MSSPPCNCTKEQIDAHPTWLLEQVCQVEYRLPDGNYTTCGRRYSEHSSSVQGKSTLLNFSI